MNRRPDVARRTGPFVAALCVIMSLFLIHGSITTVIADDSKQSIGNLDEKIGDAKITKGEAINEALKHVKGKVTDIAVERKRGKQVYVVEIAAETRGAETDVLIDTQTGAFIGIDD